MRMCQCQSLTEENLTCTYSINIINHNNVLNLNYSKPIFLTIWRGSRRNNQIFEANKINRVI